MIAVNEYVNLFISSVLSGQINLYLLEIRGTSFPKVTLMKLHESVANLNDSNLGMASASKMYQMYEAYLDLGIPSTMHPKKKDQDISGRKPKKKEVLLLRSEQFEELIKAR